MQKYEQRTIPLPECESCSETGDCIDCDLQWQLTEYGELTLARGLKRQQLRRIEQGRLHPSIVPRVNEELAVIEERIKELCNE